jgi:hypothetical protein
MCKKCDVLDVKIERYRRLSDHGMEAVTRQAAAELIAESIAEKATFGCAPKTS